GRCLHGMEGQVSHACPRNHQVPRLLKKVNSALVNEVEDVSKIFVWREVLIGPWAVLFQPVFVPLFRVLRNPGERVPRGFDDAFLHTASANHSRRISCSRALLAFWFYACGLQGTFFLLESFL